MKAHTLWWSLISKSSSLSSSNTSELVYPSSISISNATSSAPTEASGLAVLLVKKSVYEADTSQLESEGTGTKTKKKLEFDNLQHTQRPTNSMQLLMDCSAVHMVVGPAMTTFWMQMSNLIVSLQIRDYIPLFRQEVVDGRYWQQSTRVKLPICFQCWYNLRKRNDNLLNRSNRRLRRSLWSYTPWPCSARVPRSLNMQSTTKNQNC